MTIQGIDPDGIQHLTPAIICRKASEAGRKIDAADGDGCGIDGGMRRNARSITTSPDIVRHIQGLTDANFQLLTRLVPWLDANEKTQRKFRTVVIDKLARIESAVSLLLVGQNAQKQGILKRYCYEPEKLEADTKLAEEFIANQSGTALLETLRYIHAESPVPECPRDRRRRWWGWEI